MHRETCPGDVSFGFAISVLLHGVMFKAASKSRKQRLLINNAEFMGASERSVLVVDDYRDCADTLVEMLCLCGFDARACYSTEAALAAASTIQPRVVLMEPTMPGHPLDGYQLASLLRQGRGRGELLLAAFSTAGQPQQRQRMEQAGFDAVILKPDTALSVLTLVRSRLNPS